MNRSVYLTYHSPVGVLYLIADGEGMLAIENREPGNLKEGTCVVLQQCLTALKEYFAGDRKNFREIPISPALGGTPFQRKVWNALRDIPYGETRTYAQIAQAVGSPKACRAVGGANHRNPLPIIVPCHRVIGADRSLTGFGLGLDVKEKLLTLEGVINKLF